jgi:hypothetical protein
MSYNTIFMTYCQEIYCLAGDVGIEPDLTAFKEQRHRQMTNLQLYGTAEWG